MPSSCNLKIVLTLFQRFVNAFKSYLDLNDGKEEVELTNSILDIHSKLCSPRLQVAIVGLVKSGKSSVINGTILGGLRVSPTNVLPETLGITFVEDFNPRNFISSPEMLDPPPILLRESDSLKVPPGAFWQEQRDKAIERGERSIEQFLKSQNEMKRNGAENIPMTDEPLIIRSIIPWTRNGEIPVRFVDSPGANEASVAHLQKTISRILSNSDVLVYVLDVTQLGTTDEQSLLTSIANNSPDLLRNIAERGLFILNKIDRAGKNKERFILKVQEFLRKITCDQKPLEIPANRILLLSAEFGYLGLAYQRGFDKMREEDKELFLSKAFGDDPPSLTEISETPKYQEKLQRVANRLLNESGCTEFRESLEFFLSTYSTPVFLISILSKIKQHISTMMAQLRRREATIQMDAKQINESILRIQTVLTTILNSKKLNALRDEINETYMKWTQFIRDWKSECDVELINPPEIHVTYPSRPAAEAETLHAAKEVYTQWLLKLLNSKNTVSSKIREELVKVKTSLSKSYEGMVDSIVKAFDGGSGILPDPEGFKEGLSGINVQEVEDPSPAPLDIQSINHAISTQVKETEYTEMEKRLVEEDYFETEYKILQRTRSYGCGKYQPWEERVPHTVRKTRKVLRDFPVKQTKQLTDYIVSSGTIRSVVQEQCSRQLNHVCEEIEKSVNITYLSLMNQWNNITNEKVIAFIDSLKKDRKRNRQSNESKAAELLAVQNILHELSNLNETINELVSLTQEKIKSVKGLVDSKPSITSEDNTRMFDYIIKSLPKPCSESTSQFLQVLQSSSLPIDQSLVNDFSSAELNFDLAALRTIFASLAASKGKPFHILLGGLMKCGKTTVINSFLQAKIAASGVLPETSRVLKIVDAERCKSSDIPELVAAQFGSIATGYKSVKDLLQSINAIDRHRLSESSSKVALDQASKYVDKELILISKFPWLPIFWRAMPIIMMDTPGFNEAQLEKEVHGRVLEALEICDALVYVLDSTRLGQSDEAELISHLHGMLKKSLNNSLNAKTRSCDFNPNPEFIRAWKRVLGGKNDSFYSRPFRFPVIFVVNKVDEWMIRNKGKDCEELRIYVYEWLVHQIRSLFEHENLSRELIEEMLPINHVILTSASNALYGYSLRSGLIEEGDLIQILEFIGGKDYWTDFPSKFSDGNSGLPDLTVISNYLIENSYIGNLYEMMTYLIMDYFLPRIKK